MMRMNLSSAGSALLRALVARAGIARDRILLSDWRSTDWQSLTFMGERHSITLRVPGPGSREIADRLAFGLSEADFRIPGHVVADIALINGVECALDGSTTLCIEALTIAE